MVYREEILEIKQDAIDKVNHELETKKESNKKLLGIFLLLLMNYYREYSQDEKLSVNKYQSQLLLNDVKEKIIEHIEPQRNIDLMSGVALLSGVIKNSYERHQNLIGGSNNKKFDSDTSEEIIFKTYEGNDFEGRIIRNNKRLAGGLYLGFEKILSNGFMLGVDSNMLSEVFEKHEYETYRLLMNEQGRVFNSAQRMVLTEENNIEKIMWVSALCQNTCPYCEMMDGSIFDVTSDAIPEIPAHVLCQCCWIPV